MSAEQNTDDEYTSEMAMEEVVEKLEENLRQETKRGRSGAEIESNAKSGGSPAESGEIRRLFDTLESVYGFSRDSDLKVKEKKHPVSEHEFDAEIDTDLGTHQLEMAGAPERNAADTLLETLRVFDIIRYAERHTDEIEIQDSSLIDSWMYPDIEDDLDLEMFLEVASGKRDFTEQEVENIDRHTTSGPRYRSFRDSDGDLITAMEAGLAVHLNSALPEGMEYDEFARAAYNDIGVQEFLASIFANGALVSENGNETYHQGRGVLPYAIFGARGRFDRAFDEDGNVKTDYEDQLGVELPRNLSYVDIVDDDEEIEGLKDVVEKKFSGPLKRIEDLDLKLVEDIDPGAVQMLQKEHIVPDEEDEEFDVWASVIPQEDSFLSLKDYVEQGYLPVEVHLGDETFESRYKLPKDPEKIAEAVWNLYEDSDTFTRGGTDIKANGIAEGRMWDTNLERLEAELLVSQGVVNNLVEIEENYRELFGLEDYDEANELGREIGVHGPEVQREDSKYEDASEDSFSLLDGRTAYRKILPDVEEGVRRTFSDNEVPYSMELVLANRHMLEDQESFKELLYSNFRDIDDFRSFQQGVFEDARREGARFEKVYEVPQRGEYSSEADSEMVDDFIDWFVEKGVRQPMQHYLDPEVPTGSQEQLEEMGY